MQLARNSPYSSDPTLHSRCRKFNSPAFRPDNLRKAGSVLNSQMDDLVMRLKTDCEGGKYIDMIQLFPRLTLDMCVARWGLRPPLRSH